MITDYKIIIDCRLLWGFKKLMDRTIKNRVQIICVLDGKALNAAFIF